MSNAAIDQNSRNTIILYNETTGLIEDALVDPVTGALMIYGVASSGGTFTALDHAKVDGNSRNTLSAFNDTSGQIEALRCGPNGELLITAV